MEIKQLEKQDEPRWDEFVQSNDAATFYHQVGWKNVVENTFRHKPFYLFTEENGEITGILPLFQINTIFRKSLVSLPYSPYGGVCAESGIAVDALIKEATALSESLNVKFLELRNTTSMPELPSNDNYFTLALRLGQEQEIIWKNFQHGLKLRIKKATKEDFDVALDSKNIKGFYAVYCRHMRDLGTPALPFSFFNHLLSEFPNTSVGTIAHGGKIIAGHVLLFFRKTVIYGWSVSRSNYLDLNPNHLLLWQVIQHCHANGFEVFDFGRSTQDSGTYHFKKSWGAEPQPLFYQYYLRGTDKVPYAHPSNPEYDRLVRLWQKLPLFVANKLGPVVRKSIV